MPEIIITNNPYEFNIPAGIFSACRHGSFFLQNESKAYGTIHLLQKHFRQYAAKGGT